MIECPLKPVKDLVVIEPLGKCGEFASPGGIIVMGDHKGHKYWYGRVVAVGPGAIAGYTGERLPMDVAVGDLVAHVERTGWDFGMEGKEYRVIRETDVWVVLKVVPADVRARLDQLDGVLTPPSLGVEEIFSQGKPQPKKRGRRTK